MSSLTNQKFLKVVLTSFESFINSKTSRSTQKLKPLHGAIAKDIAARLGTQYDIISQGYGEGKETKIQGRYIDKMVDITILDAVTKTPVAGIAVKFVMQNYSQNSNNYFENMLGETANIRTADCPYFQIFIILDKLPYYENKGKIKHWEEFTDHNVKKYNIMSEDDVNMFFHTPNKTLIYVVHVTPEPKDISTKSEYMNFYATHHPAVKLTSHKYDLKKGGTVIFNDYETFADKIYHTVLAR